MCLPELQKVVELMQSQQSAAQGAPGGQPPANLTPQQIFEMFAQNQTPQAPQQQFQYRQMLNPADLTGAIDAGKSGGAPAPAPAIMRSRAPGATNVPLAGLASAERKHTFGNEDKPAAAGPASGAPLSVTSGRGAGQSGPHYEGGNIGMAFGDPLNWTRKEAPARGGYGKPRTAAGGEIDIPGYEWSNSEGRFVPLQDDSGDDSNDF